MRADRQRLIDILEAVALLNTFREGKTRVDLDKDLLLQSAILHQLFVIGEACSRISSSLKVKYSSVPWRAIAGFRNHIAHEYFFLDLDILWQTLTSDLPKLESELREIQRKEFS